jgi:lipoate---protein ligase
VVLGSAQDRRAVDEARAAAAGVGVARRPSGGGAVLVGPGQGVWVDVVIPAGDPLWHDDVGRAMWWLGEEWRAAIESVLPEGSGWSPSVWRGPLVRTAWSGRVCFGGLGPGEVTVAQTDGQPAKVVGISQRRTRSGALFQCTVLIRWQPAELLDVLAVEPEARVRAEVDLAGAATGLGATAGAAADALARQLVGADGGCQD